MVVTLLNLLGAAWHKTITKLQEHLNMSKYVEIGYPIYEGMPVFPGLPEVKLEPKERLDKGMTGTEVC